MDGLNFPNGIAVSPDNNTLAIGDCTAGRMIYGTFAGPTASQYQRRATQRHIVEGILTQRRMSRLRMRVVDDFQSKPIHSHVPNRRAPL